jgi:hypothetical protein
MCILYMPFMSLCLICLICLLCLYVYTLYVLYVFYVYYVFYIYSDHLEGLRAAAGVLSVRGGREAYGAAVMRALGKVLSILLYYYTIIL